ncbi:hypothetical protein [Lysobacter gummosus]|uniref:hypothetical protein n=1 Tax=Lysobacter gummosus TaxID=262324 RepID=UPI00362F4FF0
MTNGRPVAPLRTATLRPLLSLEPVRCASPTPRSPPCPSRCSPAPPSPRPRSP